MDRSRQIKITIGALIALVIVAYIYFELRNFLLGPEIIIHYPENGSTVEQPRIEIKGTTKNVSSIFLNDNPIFIDEGGNFQEPLILPPGYNIIEVTVEDRFGRIETETVEIYLDDK